MGSRRSSREGRQPGDRGVATPRSRPRSARSLVVEEQAERARGHATRGRGSAPDQTAPEVIAGVRPPAAPIESRPRRKFRISALLSPTGVPAALLRRWLDGEFELIVSPLLLAELKRALAYPKLPSRVTEEEAKAFPDLLQRARPSPAILRIRRAARAIGVMTISRRSHSRSRRCSCQVTPTSKT